MSNKEDIFIDFDSHPLMTLKGKSIFEEETKLRFANCKRAICTHFGYRFTFESKEQEIIFRLKYL
jgi:hypothetical protein